MAFTIEVTAGAVEGTLVAEHTREWEWTAQDETALADESGAPNAEYVAARNKWSVIHDEANEYVGTLSSDESVTWISRMWRRT